MYRFIVSSSCVTFFFFCKNKNLGFNLAEATNFATSDWCEKAGVKAGICHCFPDSVRIDLNDFRWRVAHDVHWSDDSIMASNSQGEEEEDGEGDDDEEEGHASIVISEDEEEEEDYEDDEEEDWFEEEGVDNSGKDQKLKKRKLKKKAVKRKKKKEDDVDHPHKKEISRPKKTKPSHESNSSSSSISSTSQQQQQQQQQHSLQPSQASPSSPFSPSNQNKKKKTTTRHSIQPCAARPLFLQVGQSILFRRIDRNHWKNGKIVGVNSDGLTFSVKSGNGVVLENVGLNRLAIPPESPSNNATTLTSDSTTQPLSSFSTPVPTLQRSAVVSHLPAAPSPSSSSFRRQSFKSKIRLMPPVEIVISHSEDAIP
jgi:hypothetical protein